MQVLGVLSSPLPLIKPQYPGTRYHRLHSLFEQDLRVVKWIYIEPPMGKGRLDTHFSFLDTVFLVFQSYVQSRNEIRTEQQIYFVTTMD
jgi:hypothetical protein